MSSDESATGLKKLFFERKYPLWVLLVITGIYAIVFWYVISGM